MIRRVAIACFAVGCLLFAVSSADAHGHARRAHAARVKHHRPGLFGWRCYSAQERRNFPDCYAGYERYYGGFHANYFRDYPGNFDGLTNDRYGWGNGWAW